MHYLFFLTVALLWGSGFYLMKLAGYAFGPITIGAISTCGGSIFLWGFWLIHREKWKLHPHQILPLGYVTFFGFLFPYVAQPFLVSLIGHGFVGMMVSLVPMLTIVVSIPLLKAYPSRVQLVGVLVGVLGIILMMIDGLDRKVEPVLLMIAISVPICYATSNTLIRKSFRDVPPIILAALFMTLTTLVLTPLSFAFEQITVDSRFSVALVAILLLSVFARGLGMALFYRLIQAKGPLFAGLVTYVIPIEALLWSWFDNERITIKQIAAISIVLLVVGIVQRDIVKRGQSQSSV